MLDATAAEGVEFSAPTWANSQKIIFVVGKTAFSVYSKITLDAWGLDTLYVGFRKKAALCCCNFHLIQIMLL